MRYLPVSLADVLSSQPVGAGEYVCFAVPRVAGKIAGPLLQVASHEPPFTGMRFRWQDATWELSEEITEGKDRGLWVANPAEQ
jgi:hypothetical protein